ncbi:MAG: hypothetical protein KatS3mg113_0029 [Planctomycetaceae bacterium]|nr:MAG: hypothetical protein KatS3mg113_0029 [Planctomycetaceae bacterium]
MSIMMIIMLRRNLTKDAGWTDPDVATRHSERFEGCRSDTGIMHLTQFLRSEGYGWKNREIHQEHQVERCEEQI